MKHKGNISEIQLIRNKEIVRTFIELKRRVHSLTTRIYARKLRV